MAWGGPALVTESVIDVLCLHTQISAITLYRKRARLCRIQTCLFASEIDDTDGTHMHRRRWIWRRRDRGRAPGRARPGGHHRRASRGRSPHLHSRPAGPLDPASAAPRDTALSAKVRNGGDGGGGGGGGGDAGGADGRAGAAGGPLPVRSATPHAHAGQCRKRRNSAEMAWCGVGACEQTATARAAGPVARWGAVNTCTEQATDVHRPARSGRNALFCRERAHSAEGFAGLAREGLKRAPRAPRLKDGGPGCQSDPTARRRRDVTSDDRDARHRRWRTFLGLYRTW